MLLLRCSFQFASVCARVCGLAVIDSTHARIADWIVRVLTDQEQEPIRGLPVHRWQVHVLEGGAVQFQSPVVRLRPLMRAHGEVAGEGGGRGSAQARTTLRDLRVRGCICFVFTYVAVKHLITGNVFRNWAGLVRRSPPTHNALITALRAKWWEWEEGLWNANTVKEEEEEEEGLIKANAGGGGRRKVYSKKEDALLRTVK